jgi:hypothetical protein
MDSRTLRIIGLALVASGAALAGCTDARQARLEGAQQALAALPDVEVVSSDAAAGRITVRSRITGALSTIDLQRGTAAAPSVAPGAPGAPAETDAMPDGSGAPAERGSRGETGGAQGDEMTALAGDEATPPATAAAGPAVTSVPLAATATVVRDPQGRVQRIEGSGFSIERSPGGDGARSAPSGAGAPATVAAAAAGSAVGGAAGSERRRLNTPVVCSRGETRALQGIELDVPGAGIVAERGCTLSLANVRVRAGGWGLVVNPGATVRIDDSLVEGRTGALDLYPGASLSAWATTFRGALGRPASPPQFVDRGGNTWD